MLETFVFQRGLYSSILRFLLAHRSLFVFLMAFPFKKLCSHFQIWQCTQRQRSTGRGMGLVLGQWGYLHICWRFWNEYLSGVWRADFLLEVLSPVNWNHASFIFICFFPNISLPRGHGGPTSTLGAAERNRFLLTASYTIGSWALKIALLFHHG